MPMALCSSWQRLFLRRGLHNTPATPALHATSGVRAVTCMSSLRGSSRPHRRQHRALPRRVWASAGADSGGEVTAELPVHFELPLAVLLAGFAFEAYNAPVGGVLDTDSSGTTVAFMSKFVQEAYCGVLQVKLTSAEGLRKADVIGKSDPYVVGTVGDSAFNSSTKLVTLNPTWNETFQLYIKQTDNAVLKLNLFDYDLIGSDDSLGTAIAPLKDVCAAAPGSAHTLTLPVQDLGGGGGGGGTVTVTLRWFPFSAPTAAKLAAAAEQGGSALESPLGGALGALGGYLKRGVDAWHAEQRRKEWEEELWCVRPDSEWAALASSSSKHEVPLPQEFEKIAYVENALTDTQAFGSAGAHTLREE